ncbi:MAG: four helix bundle protein [Bacteroidia bacterium]|nr:four helix bundle protein [Bacteroidia bacterium]
MATYDNLPVYKASYDLLVEIFQFVKNFSKEYKYTVGEKLKNETLEMIMNIFRANSKGEYRSSSCIIKADKRFKADRFKKICNHK